jgi:hypothetical protein
VTKGTKEERKERRKKRLDDLRPWKKEREQGSKVLKN